MKRVSQGNISSLKVAGLGQSRLLNLILLSLWVAQLDQRLPHILLSFVTDGCHWAACMTLKAG